LEEVLVALQAGDGAVLSKQTLFLRVNCATQEHAAETPDKRGGSMWEALKKDTVTLKGW